MNGTSRRIPAADYEGIKAGLGNCENFLLSAMGTNNPCTLLIVTEPSGTSRQGGGLLLCVPGWRTAVRPLADGGSIAFAVRRVPGWRRTVGTLTDGACAFAAGHVVGWGVAVWSLTNRGALAVVVRLVPRRRIAERALADRACVSAVVSHIISWCIAVWPLPDCRAVTSPIRVIVSWRIAIRALPPRPATRIRRRCDSRLISRLRARSATNVNFGLNASHEGHRRKKHK